MTKNIAIFICLILGLLAYGEDNGKDSADIAHLSPSSGTIHKIYESAIIDVYVSPNRITILPPFDYTYMVAELIDEAGFEVENWIMYPGCEYHEVKIDDGYYTLIVRLEDETEFSGQIKLQQK